MLLKSYIDAQQTYHSIDQKYSNETTLCSSECISNQWYRIQHLIGFIYTMVRKGLHVTCCLEVGDTFKIRAWGKFPVFLRFRSSCDEQEVGLKNMTHKIVYMKRENIFWATYKSYVLRQQVWQGNERSFEVVGQVAGRRNGAAPKNSLVNYKCLAPSLHFRSEKNVFGKKRLLSEIN